MKNFPKHIRQRNDYECGVCAAQWILRLFGKEVDKKLIALNLKADKSGTALSKTVNFVAGLFKRSVDFNGTLPHDMKVVLRNHGVEMSGPVTVRVFSGDILEDVLRDCGEAFAVAFVNTNTYVAHWIAMAYDEGHLKIMDSCIRDLRNADKYPEFKNDNNVYVVYSLKELDLR